MNPEFTSKAPGSHHRRTQSETFFRFPQFHDDDILLPPRHQTQPPRHQPNDTLLSDTVLGFNPQTLQPPRQHSDEFSHFSPPATSANTQTLQLPRQQSDEFNSNFNQTLQLPRQQSDEFSHFSPPATSPNPQTLQTPRQQRDDFNHFSPPATSANPQTLQLPRQQRDEFNHFSPPATSANTQTLQLPRQQSDEFNSNFNQTLQLPRQQSDEFSHFSPPATSPNPQTLQTPRQQRDEFNQLLQLPRQHSDEFSHFSPPATSPNPQTLQPPRQQIPDEVTRNYSLSHYRSLSVDADFFAGLDMGGASWNELAEDGEGEGGRRKVRHRRSNSIDSASSSFEGVDCTKKAMAPEKLAELAISDPHKAKRILANRQSAARSKERKVRYTSELERKVQTLQVETTTLSTQVTKMQRDAAGLTTENKELRLRLEALEQQSHLRDALNEALKEELKHLKIVAGEIQVVNGNGSLYYTQLPAFNGFRVSQTQYAQQTQQQKQQQPLHVPCPTDVNPNLSRQPQPNFQGFNQRV